ncbi:MAG: glycosyltransferase family 2 protein [Eubacteriales bacterium]
MQTNIKVSIVVPVYNVEKYLHQCLDSLCAQTLREIEIICVDDGSKDNSMTILEAFARKDDRIKIFENKTEGPGAAHARNLGITKVTGDYLLILDSDDYFHPELAEKTYQKAIETEADIVLFDAMVVDNVTGKPNLSRNFVEYELLPDKDVFSPLEVKECIFQMTQGCAWNKLYHTSFVKENHLEFQAIHVIDDLFFTYSSCAKAEKITYLEEKLLSYRVNSSSSQSNNLHVNPLSPLIASLRLKEFLVKNGLFQLYFETFLEMFLGLFSWYTSKLKGFDDFSILYHSLKSEGFDQLLSGIDTDSRQDLKWLTEIQSLSCEEYIFRRLQKSEQFAYKFPIELKDSKMNVIFYGGGVRGKSLYAQNIIHNYCNIIAWVDRKYKEIGFPLMGLEILSATEFDMLYITLGDLEICETIKESLTAMGIATEKIFYRNMQLEVSSS